MTNLLRITFSLAVFGVFAMWTRAGTQAEKLPDGRGGAFDVTRHNIPLKDIEAGGPPKDGIPALTDPVLNPLSLPRKQISFLSRGNAYWVLSTMVCPRRTRSRY